MENVEASQTLEQNRIARKGMVPSQDKDVAPSWIVGFHDLFVRLSPKDGHVLRCWLNIAAEKRGIRKKHIHKVLRVSRQQYHQILCGPESSRNLPSAIFARVANWLEIPVIAALMAAGMVDIDARREQMSRGKIIDYALDTIASDPVYGEQMPAAIYFAEESVREFTARLYEHLTGNVVLPDPQDWDYVLDAMLSMQQ